MIGESRRQIQRQRRSSAVPTSSCESLTGLFRTAVLAASGISHVPITVTKVVRADECEHLTSVVRGPWPKDQAMMLVEHLFLFESMNWAIGKGLASG